MNRKLFVIALAVISLFSCEDYKEKIDDLNSNLEEENKNIASIKSQLSEIQSSITDLSKTDTDLSEYIKTLQAQREKLEQTDGELAIEIENLRESLSGDISTAEANVLSELESFRASVNSQLSFLTTSIDTLSAKDTILEKQIDELKKYVDEQSQNNRDWVSTTFTTLDQFNATANIVATIQEQIKGINARIDTIDSATGVDIEDINVAVSGLRNELQPQIKKVADDAAASLASVKKEIEDAYNTDIATAISNSETSLKSWINTQLTGYYTITQVDTKLSNLKSDLEGQLSAQKTYLSSLISNLETTLNKKIADNTKLITDLSFRADGFDSDIAELVTRIATNAGLIQTNANNISYNAARIDTCKANIDSCNTYIAANKKLIKENESAIEANKTALSTLTGRITIDEDSILANAKAIAGNVQDIAINASLISSNATAISNNAQAISDNAEAIQQLHTDLETAKTEITEAYKKAISDAIIELNGTLSGRISEEVETINTRINSEVAAINKTITALTNRVEKCEQEIVTIKGNINRMQLAIDNLEEKVAAILSRIQSVTYVPEYSDGRATMSFTNNNSTITPGVATLRYRFLPAITATELASIWENAMSVEALYTLTRASANVVPLQIVSVVASNGYMDITISGTGIDNSFFKGERKVSVSLIISDGNNQIATDYVELMPRMPETIYIPDEAFRTYLIGQFDTDDDGELSLAEVEAITDINVASKSIQNLSGIEWMHNLKTLNAAGNSIKNIDLQYCNKLTSLTINDNQLNSINLAANPALTTLDVSGNHLQLLDVSKAKNINSLICSDNQIASLDVSFNSALTILQCGNNKLENLNVTANKELITLDCNNNFLTVLNLSSNTSLQYLNCSANALTSLTISYLTKLLSLDCSGNKITSLNLKENKLLRTLDCRDNLLLMRLDVSTCTSMTLLRCSGNTFLSSIMMEDEAQQTKIVLTKDNNTVLRLYSQEIPFEDSKLRNIILTNYDFDDNGIITSDEAEAIIEVNCKNKGVTSLKGLERCHNLRVIDCSSNNIQKIELPNMANLNSLACYDNPLTLLDIHGSNITHLYLVAAGTECRNGNMLTLSNYTASPALEFNLKETGITRMNVTETNLTTLSFPQSTDIKYFSALNNSQLSVINLATSITNIEANGNAQLSSLDVSALTALDNLNIYDNALSTLDISSNTALKILDCSYNSLTTLNINNNSNLKYLKMDNNNVKAINLRNNTALEFLNINNNPQISMLNLTENTALTHLEACSLAVARIDISANDALEYVNIINNANIAVLKVKDRAFYENSDRTIYFNTGNGNCEVHDINDNVIATFDSKVIPVFTNAGVWAVKYKTTNVYYMDTDGGEYSLLNLNDALLIFSNSSSHYLTVLMNTLPDFSNVTHRVLFFEKTELVGYYSDRYRFYFSGTSESSLRAYSNHSAISYAFKRIL